MSCPVPQELSRFQTPTLRYIRVCDKVDHTLKTQRRVLLVTAACVFLCEVKGSVKRYLPYEKMDEVLMSMDEHGVMQVLFKLQQPEHDLLLRFTNDPLNATHAKRDEMQKLGEILATLSKRYRPDSDLSILIQGEGSSDLSTKANLVKSKSYKTPSTVYRESKKMGRPVGPPPPKPQQQPAPTAPQDAPPVEEAPTPTAADKVKNVSISVPKEEDEKRLRELERREQEVERKEREVRRMQEQVEAALMGGLEPVAATPDKLQLTTDPGDSVAMLPPMSPYTNSPFRKRTLSGLHSPKHAASNTAGLTSEYVPNSYWLSQHYNPTACRASPSPDRKVSELPIPPAQDPLPAHNETLDYWTRFVQRWEAQGLQYVEGL